MFHNPLILVVTIVEIYPIGYPILLENQQDCYRFYRKTTVVTVPVQAEQTSYQFAVGNMTLT